MCWVLVFFTTVPCNLGALCHKYKFSVLFCASRLTALQMDAGFDFRTSVFFSSSLVLIVFVSILIFLQGLCLHTFMPSRAIASVHLQKRTVRFYFLWPFFFSYRAYNRATLKMEKIRWCSKNCRYACSWDESAAKCEHSLP